MLLGSTRSDDETSVDDSELRQQFNSQYVSFKAQGLGSTIVSAV